MDSISPWRKRLNDLAQLIEQAHEAYFEPELFRLYLNQAITTARTVTFIIQKNKDDIPGYDELYVAHVLGPMKADPIMQWLIASRNTIEKEGDLDTFSELKAQIVFSYTEDGPSINAAEHPALFAGTRDLQRFWSTHVPPAVASESAIMIDRRWIANTLPDHEIIDAILHGYGMLAKAVGVMDAAIGFQTKSEHLPALRDLGSAMRRTYVKFSDGIMYGTGIVDLLATVDQSRVANERYGSFDSRFLAPMLSLTDRVNAWADLAVRVFNIDGYHRSMYLLLRSDGSVLSLGNVEFADRVEKYIFWRTLGDLAKLDRSFCGVVFVGESWIRSMDVVGVDDGDISALPIVGETLTFSAENHLGEYVELSFVIDRNRECGYVDRSDPMPPLDGVVNIFSPLRKVWADRH